MLCDALCSYRDWPSGSCNTHCALIECPARQCLDEVAVMVHARLLQLHIDCDAVGYNALGNVDHLELALWTQLLSVCPAKQHLDTAAKIKHAWLLQQQSCFLHASQHWFGCQRQQALCLSFHVNVPVWVWQGKPNAAVRSIPISLVRLKPALAAIASSKSSYCTKP